MDARRRFAGVGAACVLVCFFSACGGSPLSLGSPAPPISVSVSPAIAAVQTGSTALLNATVFNDPRYRGRWVRRSGEHTSEIQSQSNLVCRLLLLKKKKHYIAG